MGMLGEIILQYWQDKDDATLSDILSLNFQSSSHYFVQIDLHFASRHKKVICPDIVTYSRNIVDIGRRNTRVIIEATWMNQKVNVPPGLQNITKI